MSDENGTPDDQDAPTPPTTDEMLRQLLEQRAEDRAELVAMREELAKRKAPAPVQSSVRLTAEELHAQRMQEIESHDYYCPGCGALYNRVKDCQGRPEAPHPPIEVVSTDELKSDDPSKHTAAPGINP